MAEEPSLTQDSNIQDSSLSDGNSSARSKDGVPLPERLRPDSFDLFLGQPHLEKRIHTLLNAPHLPSLLFFGPPGCGKSTIALLLAKSTGKTFRRISAPEAGISALRTMLKGVDLLILDELHRFSKAQQDFFLPRLEEGSLTLLATTTENPSFSVTRQLLSRLSVLRLRPLDLPELLELARRGADQMGADISDAILNMLADYSRGDARTLLNLVEYVASLPGRKEDPEAVKAVLPDIISRHDRDGDSHYEMASALIKSIRGSDPDAAVYWLSCLLEGGEDPRFICRRLILSASEDVGLADPEALTMAVSCQQAVEFVGMPEGFIPLSETVVYLALAPKSNSSYAACLNARKVIRSQGAMPVPLHLRNATTKLQQEWGYGRGYLYPHNYPKGYVEQEYLPEGVAQTRFYSPKENGKEPSLAAMWKRRKKIN
ncbi:MAG: replication-associated recombination protein A [Desulfovibrionaceae bacterium]|nr:replication-associated recombination protein A [Desulfovibrionaceae bacterium]